MYRECIDCLARTEGKVCLGVEEGEQCLNTEGAITEPDMVFEVQGTLKPKNVREVVLEVIKRQDL